MNNTANQEVKTKSKLSGEALVNKFVMIVTEVITAALIFGYISAYMSGANLIYFIVFEISAITTFFTILFVYKKKPEKLKYVAFICFSIVYAIGILGADTDVAFVMGFAIVVAFVLYYDYKLMVRVTTTFAVICSIDIVYIIFFLKKQHSGLPVNSANILMEFLGTLIFLIAVRITTKISNKNNSDKLNTIQEVSDKVNESIKNVNGELNRLNRASESVQHAMEDINSGVNNVVEAVQEQLLQTEAIQDRIDNVQDTAGSISTNIAKTLEAVETGNTDVAALVGQADKSVEISGKVTNALGDLKERMDAMESITKMIENIAFQTNLMALNANVEAARAGEAGRGFAVVATEISRMSAQTKTATDNISELIGNATDSLKELVSSIEEMTAVINSERIQTNETSEVFSTIKSSTMEVQNNIGLFMEYLGSLTDANRSIVQSVQTISATTEEVNALTNETLIKEQNNGDVRQSIAKQLADLAK